MEAAHVIRVASMNHIIRILSLSLILCGCILSTAVGQIAESSNMINTTLLEQSSMKIIGSSTLHEWEVDASEFSVQFQVPGLWFEAQESWEGSDVTQLKVTVPVDKLDGGKNKMNRDLRDALKFPEFQTIQFTWEQISFTDETETGRRIEVEGSVTIAGETRKISFDADLSLNESSQIVASGNVKLNMEEFGVKAPKAFFGVIRTDEIVNLSFEILLDGEEF